MSWVLQSMLFDGLADSLVMGNVRAEYTLVNTQVITTTINNIGNLICSA